MITNIEVPKGYEMPPESKPFWKSKTFWFNVLAVVLLIAGQFGYKDFKPNEDLLQIVGILIPLFNVVLRKITTQPVHL